MTIQIKTGYPGRGMTFSQRRRLIHLLWVLISNSALPFILGFILCLISVTHSFVETITAFDKTGFGVCVQPDSKEQGGKQ